MGSALNPPSGIVEVKGLAPLDDVIPIAEEVMASDAPIMLVGHLPFMERIAGYILTEDETQAVVQFHKGGIVCLTQGEERWQVKWIITPEVAGA